MTDQMGTKWFNYVGYDDLSWLRADARANAAFAPTVEECQAWLGWGILVDNIIQHLDDQFLPGDGIGFYPDNIFQRLSDGRQGIVRRT